MLRTLVILPVLLFSLTATTFAADSDPALTSIFNGKDLTGWKAPKGNTWWTVSDGVLHCKSGPKKKGSILSTEKSYANYIIQLDFKFGKGTIDSGVFMRNNREQIQIGISGSLKRDMTCSPYIPGKGYPVEAKGVKELLKATDWNTIKIKAVGKTYSVSLNGKHVMEYTSKSAIEKGPLGLQLHGNRNMAIDFRNIAVAELPAK